MRKRDPLFAPPLPLHLPLLALYLPLLTCVAQLPFEPPTAAVRVAFAILAVALGLFAALTALNRNLRASALAVSILLLVFSAGGWLQGAPMAVGLAAWPVSGVLAALTACSKRSFITATRGANLFLAVFVLPFVAAVVWIEARPDAPTVNHRYGGPPMPPRTPAVASAPDTRPDIYVFVVDGYARADVLRSIYGYDDPLVTDLQHRGFFVAPRGFANYAQTALSLASSLNLEYLPALLENVSSDQVSRRACARLIHDSLAFRLLRSAGYRLVTFASEYGVIKIEGAARRYRWPLHPTEFDYALHDVSGLPALAQTLGLPPAWLPHNLRCADLNWTLGHLSGPIVSRGDPPTVVFAHLLLPHPPFTFLPDGRYSWTRMPANTWDGEQWRDRSAGSGETYQGGYLRNMAYLRPRLLRAVDAVLARGGRRSIILIHADHGPGSRLDWSDPRASDLRERMGILLAARFPDGNPASVGAPQSPVNAMRLLVAEALGLDLPRLDDRAWFSTWSRPYEFADVTERVER